MADLLELSSRIIDSGVADEPVNRITQELSEIADGVAVVESFSHVVAVRCGDGMVAFDASGSATGRPVVESLRRWTASPVTALVYTHGHLDHVGGSPAFVADASAQGFERPVFLGHTGVVERFARYRMTDAWNRIINERQFGWTRNTQLRAGAGVRQGGKMFGDHYLPPDVAEPDVVYTDLHLLEVDGVAIELRHGKGETDDHTWAWIPSLQAVCCGDFLIWNFPNAGNPQKVQRYPLEWAQSLRAMAELEPELLVPAHGLPIGGSARIRSVLLDVASVLEDLVARTVEMMNGGATLDDVVHTVKVPEEALSRPYLRPLYDEPEFVVRNIWRLYGGWWDANPARLKPPADAHLSAEVASLAGGADVLVARALELMSEGELRLACQLVEWAATAAPEDRSVHEARATVYGARYKSESSLMAKGIFAGAAGESREKAGEA